MCLSVKNMFRQAFLYLSIWLWYTTLSNKVYHLYCITGTERTRLIHYENFWSSMRISAWSLIVVWDHTLREFPQSLFAKFAAGPPGRPAMLVWSPAQPPGRSVKYRPDKE